MNPKADLPGGKLQVQKELVKKKKKWKVHEEDTGHHVLHLIDRHAHTGAT